DKAGIHFGCTKDEYSISRNPDFDNILIQFTLSAVGTHFFSFCSPSRGPTSLICTCFGQRFIDHPSYYFSLSSRKLRSEEHTSELQSRFDLVCRLLLEKKKN